MSVGVDWVRSLTGDNILRVMTYADDFAWSEVKTLCYSQLNLAGPSAVHFVDKENWISRQKNYGQILWDAS